MKRINFGEPHEVETEDGETEMRYSDFIEVSNSLWESAVDEAVLQGDNPREALADLLADTDQWDSIE